MIRNELETMSRTFSRLSRPAFDQCASATARPDHLGYRLSMLLLDLEVPAELGIAILAGATVFFGMILKIVSDTQIRAHYQGIP